jgi:hypothetical protein
VTFFAMMYQLDGPFLCGAWDVMERGGVCTFWRVWMVFTKLSSDAGTVCDRKFMLLSRAIAQRHH